MSRSPPCPSKGPGSVALASVTPTEPPGASDAAQIDVVVPCAGRLPIGKRAVAGPRGKAVSAKLEPRRDVPGDVGAPQKALKMEQNAKRLAAMMAEMKMEAAGRASLGASPSWQMSFELPVRMGDEYMMVPRGHGTSNQPVQKDLRWRCDFDLADDICNFNRREAEPSGYFVTTTFVEECIKASEAEPLFEFYDSNTGKPLFSAPVGRSLEQFLEESRQHGWPSFRDAEVNWHHVRVLNDGETVSIHGTHLGHCMKDTSGHRYCINLVSVAGRPLHTNHRNQ